MEPERDVTIWPSRETYPRFVELCDDDVPATFEEYELKFDPILVEYERQGIVIEKITCDPDRMALWCRTHFGEVNSPARSAYAAFLALSD